MPQVIITRTAALIAGLLMFQGSAAAQEIVPAPVEYPAADPAPFGATALEPMALAGIAGREDTTQVAQSRHTATVAGNSVGANSRTGEVTISDNAFQNLTGLSVINVNSGNNVAVNAAINVTISLLPPTP